jgi:hypothetical protein
VNTKCCEVYFYIRELKLKKGREKYITRDFIICTLDLRIIISGWLIVELQECLQKLFGETINMALTEV